VACAAALTVQKVIRRDGLIEQVQRRGEYLRAQLYRALGQHPHVGDIRGRGLFWGIEMVQERDSKLWFDPAHRLHARIKAQAMKNGLAIYPMGGTVDGLHGDHILLAPPFIASEAHLDELVDKLVTSIDASLESIGVPSSSLSQAVGV